MCVSVCESAVRLVVALRLPVASAFFDFDRFILSSVSISRQGILVSICSLPRVAIYYFICFVSYIF